MRVRPGGNQFIFSTLIHCIDLLRNWVALVLGGGSGIGRSVAITYACEGVGVVASDIDQAAGQQMVGFANSPAYTAASHGLTATWPNKVSHQ